MSTLMNGLSSSHQEQEEVRSSRSSSPASSIFGGELYAKLSQEHLKAANNDHSAYRARLDLMRVGLTFEPTLSDVSTSQSTNGASSSQESFVSNSYLMSSQSSTSSSQFGQRYTSQNCVDNNVEVASQDCWAQDVLTTDHMAIQAAALQANRMLQQGENHYAQSLGSVNPSKVWKPQKEEKICAQMLGQFEQLPPPPPVNFHGDSLYSIGDDYSPGNEVFSQKSIENDGPPPMSRSRLGDARAVTGDLPGHMLSGVFRPETATNEQLQMMGYTSSWTDTRGNDNNSGPFQEGRAYYEVFGGNKKRKVLPQVKAESSYPRVKIEDEEVDELMSGPEDDEPSSSSNFMPPPPPRSLVGKTDRAKNACTHCHRRKTKCTEERPTCAHCRQVGADCEYPKEIRRRGKGKKKGYRGGDASTNRSHSVTPSQGYRRLSSIELASELAVAAVTSSQASESSSSSSSKKRRKSDQLT